MPYAIDNIPTLSRVEGVCSAWISVGTRANLTEIFVCLLRTSSNVTSIVPCPSLCLPPAFTLVSCSGHSSTLKMEAKCSSETSVDSRRTTRRYIPEIVLFITCENLRSYVYWCRFYTTQYPFFARYTVAFQSISQYTAAKSLNKEQHSNSNMLM
jgi:hypothetical protein